MKAALLIVILGLLAVGGYSANVERKTDRRAAVPSPSRSIRWDQESNQLKPGHNGKEIPRPKRCY